MAGRELSASGDTPPVPDQPEVTNEPTETSNHASIEQALAALEDAALVVDATGRVVLSNPSAQRLLELNLSTPPNVLDFVASRDRAELVGFEHALDLVGC